MDKKELKEDLIRDRIIDFIEYISENSINVFILVLLVVGGISTYTFLSNKKIDEFNLSSELSGLAQNEYNQGDSIFAIDDLQQVLNDYEETPGGSQAYIYLIYDAYINDDIDKLESLFDNYSIYLKDPFLKASVVEAKAYLAMNTKDYSSAIELINKSLKINDIKSIKTRLDIAKARIYIANKNYEEAQNLLEKISSDSAVTNSQKNVIDELTAYVIHIQN